MGPFRSSIFAAACGIFHCGMWDLVPPELGAQSLGHWTTREVPKLLCYDGCWDESQFTQQNLESLTLRNIREDEEGWKDWNGGRLRLQTRWPPHPLSCYWVQISYAFHKWMNLRESIPRQTDKKSRVPKEEKGVWDSWSGDRGLEFSGRRKGQAFFVCILLSLSQLHNSV